MPLVGVQIGVGGPTLHPTTPLDAPPCPVRTLVHRRMSATEVRSRGRPRQRRWWRNYRWSPCPARTLVHRRMSAPDGGAATVEPERCFDRSLGRSGCAPEETGLTPVDSRGYRIVARERHRAGGLGRGAAGYFPSSSDTRWLLVLNVSGLATRRPSRARCVRVRSGTIRVPADVPGVGGRVGSTRSDWLRQDVAATAASITLVTAAGRLMSPRWPALKVSMVAFARSDMNSCRAGGIT